MTFLSVEQLSEKGVRDNEDALLVDQDAGLFAVFDGASALVPFRSPDGKTGARIAAETARDSFMEHPEESLRALAQAANIAIQSQHLRYGIDLSDPVNRFSCTLAAAQIRDGVLAIMQNADSLVLVKDVEGNVSVPLGYTDHDLPIMTRWKELADQGRTDMRAVLDRDILALRERANTPDGYGVLNGDPAAIEACKLTSIALGTVASVLILTDGLFLPKEDPGAEDKWSQYFDICEERGLQGLLQTVRSIEKTDPELKVFPRYKIHDDATGIYLKLK